MSGKLPSRLGWKRSAAWLLSKKLVWNKKDENGKLQPKRLVRIK